jgi:hypothetical protein
MKRPRHGQSRRNGGGLFSLQFLFIVFIIMTIVATMFTVVVHQMVFEVYSSSKKYVRVHYMQHIRETCQSQALTLLDWFYFEKSEDTFRREIAKNHPAPIDFEDLHTSLCSGEDEFINWSDCLPISAKTDLDHCPTTQRMDLFDIQRSGSAQLCRKTVLQMILRDVYDGLEEVEGMPILVFGTLLGAVRNQSVIDFTEDVDIGYKTPDGLFTSFELMKRLQKILMRRGYHVFFSGIWRVCVAPHHPLAAYMYDPKRNISKQYTVPYADLYEMYQEKFGTKWKIEKTTGGWKVPAKKFLPLQKIKVDTEEYNTVADPKYFLQQEYGLDYMKPLPRNKLL